MEFSAMSPKLLLIALLGLLAGVASGCVLGSSPPSTTWVFADMHDGDQKMVTFDQATQKLTVRAKKSAREAIL